MLGLAYAVAVGMLFTPLFALAKDSRFAIKPRMVVPQIAAWEKANPYQPIPNADLKLYQRKTGLIGYVPVVHFRRGQVIFSSHNTVDKMDSGLKRVPAGSSILRYNAGTSFLPITDPIGAVLVRRYSEKTRTDHYFFIIARHHHHFLASALVASPLVPMEQLADLSDLPSWADTERVLIENGWLDPWDLEGQYHDIDDFAKMQDTTLRYLIGRLALKVYIEPQVAGQWRIKPAKATDHPIWIKYDGVGKTSFEENALVRALYESEIRLPYDQAHDKLTDLFVEEIRRSLVEKQLRQPGSLGTADLIDTPTLVKELNLTQRVANHLAIISQPRACNVFVRGAARPFVAPP